MTVSDSRRSDSAAPDPTSVKEAFVRCFAISDLEQQQQALDRLGCENPRLAAEVRSLLDGLRSSKKVEKVSAFVPMLDLSLKRMPEALGDLSGELSTLARMDASVLRSMEQTAAGVPRLVLESPGEEEPIVKVRSSEFDSAWNKSDGRYRLDGEIARGGMGAILKGRDTDLGRDLAVKVLLNEHRDNPETVRRFIEEAQIGGQLQHPGIAPVYELGQFQDQRPFFTMKLIKGKTLSALLAERKPLDDDRSRYLGIFQQVCQTMAYAHSRGVLHRDLKPSNVMVGAFGEVQVMDWGLAKVLATGGPADERKQDTVLQVGGLTQTVRSVERDSTYDDKNSSAGSATRMGSIMGTPAYMSPEQAMGEIDRLDRRSDVFSLGSMLCEILTGDPAYPRGDDLDPLVRARRGEIEEACSRLDTSKADPELVQLAKHCLAIDRDQRPADAQAVSERINAYLESVDQRLRETELEVARSKTKAEEERKRRRVVVALAGSVVLAALLGAGGWAWVLEKESQLENIRTEAKVAAAIERTELEQQIQAELAAAAALADGTNQAPTKQDLARAMEAARRAQADLGDRQGFPKLAARVRELLSEVEHKQTDLDLVERLQQIWEIEQQYLAENDLPPVQWVSSDNTQASAPAAGDDAGAQGTRNPAILYQQAFAKWGFQLQETSQRDMISRIERMPSSYKTSVIASLDRWRRLLDAEYSLTDWVQHRWDPLKPIEFNSTRGDQFRVSSSHSVVVTGPQPNQGHHITFETHATKISALRLEALLDESLPQNGPGRGHLGMFDLQGLKVRVAPRTNPNSLVAVQLVAGTTDYADPNWPFQVDRWRTWGGGGRPHVAFYRLAEPIIHPDGFRIEVMSDRGLDMSLEQGTLGHFRWSVTQLDDHFSSKALLDSLLADLDSDPWRKRLRKALADTNIGELTKLAAERTAVSHQPSILLAQLAHRLMSPTGAELESQLMAETDFPTVHPAEVTAKYGTEYSVSSDGTIVARGENPQTEETTVVIPPEEIRRTTQLIRIELLGANGDVEGSYIGRRRYLNLRELSVSQALNGRSRSVVARIFTRFSDSVSLAKAVDGASDTVWSIPNPDRPRALYIVLDQKRFVTGQPLTITLHTGGNGNFRRGNPARFRIMLGSPAETFSDPFVAAEQLLTWLAAAQPSDPLVQLQLARYYKSSHPVRTDDALRHAMIAGSLLQESIVPSLAFIDMLEPSYLIDNPPFRQVAIEHLRRVEERHPGGSRTMRLRLSLEAAVIDKYSQGEFAEAEQLIEFALATLHEQRAFIALLIARMPWDELPVEASIDSLVRYLERSVSAESNDPSGSSLAQFFNMLSIRMQRLGRDALSLALLDKAIQVSPNYLQAHHNRGSILTLLERFEDAEKQYRAHIKIDPTDPNPRFNLAKLLFEQGKLDSAFNEFRSANQLATRDPARAAHMIGQWLVRRKSMWLEDLKAVAAGAEETSTESRRPIPTGTAVRAAKEGIIYLEQAADLRPDDKGIARDLGVAHYRIGDWKEAISRLEQLEAISIEDYERDRWHLFVLSMAHRWLGNEEAAYRYYGLGSAWVDRIKGSDTECQRIREEANALLQLDPSEQHRLQAEGFDLWLQELDVAISKNPTDSARWFYRGQVYGHLKRTEQAIADFSKVIELEPLDPDLLGWRSGAYTELGQLELALADRNRAVELQPWYNFRYFERARTYRDMGEHRLAVADIDRGFQVDSASDASWLSRAQARTFAGDIYLQHLRNHAEAVKQYDQALELEPDRFLALRGRAHANAMLKHHDQALSDIGRAIAIQPDDATAFAIRGQIHWQLDQLDLARVDYDMAVQLDPSNSTRYLERARLHRRRGDIDLAIADIQQAIKVHPDGDNASFSRAKAHELAGDIYRDDLEQPGQALLHYDKSLAIDPGDVKCQEKRRDIALAVKSGSDEEIAD